jgi:hypothetical protein
MLEPIPFFAEIEETLTIAALPVALSTVAQARTIW